MILTYATMCYADLIPTSILYFSMLSIKGNKSTTVAIILFNFTAASQKLYCSSSKTLTCVQTRNRAHGVVGMHSPQPAPEPTYTPAFRCHILRPRTARRCDGGSNDTSSPVFNQSRLRSTCGNKKNYLNGNFVATAFAVNVNNF